MTNNATDDKFAICMICRTPDEESIINCITPNCKFTIHDTCLDEYHTSERKALKCPCGIELGHYTLPRSSLNFKSIIFAFSTSLEAEYKTIIFPYYWYSYLVATYAITAYFSFDLANILCGFPLLFGLLFFLFQALFTVNPIRKFVVKVVNKYKGGNSTNSNFELFAVNLHQNNDISTVKHLILSIIEIVRIRSSNNQLDIILDNFVIALDNAMLGDSNNTEIPPDFTDNLMNGIQRMRTNILNGNNLDNILSGNNVGDFMRTLGLSTLDDEDGDSDNSDDINDDDMNTANYDIVDENESENERDTRIIRVRKVDTSSNEVNTDNRTNTANDVTNAANYDIIDDD